MDTQSDCFRFGIIERKLHPYRTEYDRDYGRVLHAPSFRRLAHKTQLFPPEENDFFRTRLTHSLEVAAIADEIGRKLQYDMTEKCHSAGMPEPFRIEPRVCEVAGLVHDLGHPPFGHNGERALNACMKDAGGFEGNAQSLHILLRLEQTDVVPLDREDTDDSAGDACKWVDSRIGLNLTARSIAAALKYDQAIPRETNGRLIKGYYQSDCELIDAVKSRLVDDVIPSGQFKTIECSIMDIADDIAYATYDLEDAFAGGFLTPLSMWSQDNAVFESIAMDLNDECHNLYNIHLTTDDCLEALRDTFSSVFSGDQDESASRDAAQLIYKRSEMYATRADYRTEQTSAMIDAFVQLVSLDFNAEHPLLSQARLSPQAWIVINTLKRLKYQLIISSPMMQVAEYRGYDIVTQLFDSVYKSKGRLLPLDYRELLKCGEKLPIMDRERWEKRVVCDFVASMSDRNAVEFHGRMYSTDGATIFKPL